MHVVISVSSIGAASAVEPCSTSLRVLPAGDPAAARHLHQCSVSQTPAPDQDFPVFTGVLTFGGGQSLFSVLSMLVSLQPTFCNSWLQKW